MSLQGTIVTGRLRSELCPREVKTENLPSVKEAERPEFCLTEVLLECGLVGFEFGEKERFEFICLSSEESSFSII